MASVSSELPQGVKLLIAGGFGVGKTTLVGAVSQIAPLSTEAPITEASRGIDDIALTGGKTTTTVALDFGRVGIGAGYTLLLFGLPGQRRFWFLWDQLVIGALGVVVLVDTRRIEDSFDAVGYFERHGVPFIIAVNTFEQARFTYTEYEVRQALRLDASVPVVFCDARARSSVISVLIRLVQHVLTCTDGAPTAAPHPMLEGTYI